MSEYLESIGIAMGALPWIVFLSCTAFFLLYRRYIVSAFDPLVMLVIAMVADSILVFALPWQPALKWEYASFSLFLWLGFRTSARLPQRVVPAPMRTGELYDLEAVLVVLFAIVTIGNLVLGFAAGFPLLSANPSESKVTLLTGGLGLVRRINMGPMAFFRAGCFYLIFQGYRRQRAILMLAVSTVFSALSGSKGALLPLVFTPALLLAHRGFRRTRALAPKTKRRMLYGFCAGVAIGLAVTIKDSGSITGGIAGLARRLLLTGDVVLFYFSGRERVIQETTRSLLGYLQYLTNDSLAMLRLAEYKEPLGSVILGAGNNGFGPNAQYFVRADLFFGPQWGCLYSLLIGFCIGKLRTWFFSASPSYPVRFVLLLTAALLADNLFYESSMFLQTIVSICLTVFPIWLVVRLIRKGQSICAPRNELNLLGI